MKPRYAGTRCKFFIFSRSALKIEVLYSEAVGKEVNATETVEWMQGRR